MVSDVYYPFPGGITEHVHHLSYYLMGKGHDVVILTGNHKNGKKIGLNSVKVIRVGRGILIPINRSFYSLPVSFHLQSRVREVLMSQEWDIVHVHGTFSPSLPLFTLLQSPYTNFMTFHPTHGYSIGFEIFKPILQRAYENIHGKIAVSKSAERSISRHFPGDYRIIPNGVDIHRFGPHVMPEDGLREGNEKIILFVGRIEPRKGLSTLLKAFEKLLKQGENVKLLVVGDTPLRKVFELKAQKFGSRVKFLGKVTAEEIPGIYRASDVFVAPATGKESFGIVLIEALASGKPVVASDIDGYREIISHGVDGFLVEPGDADSLARHIEKILKNPELASKMGEMGRRKVMERYSWEIVSSMVEDYYFEVLENAKKVLR